MLRKDSAFYFDKTKFYIIIVIMILKIIKYPNPILRKKSKKIEIIDRKIKKLAQDMLETLKSAQGLGLAAPQVGESISLFVLNFGEKSLVFINPEIIKKSKKKEVLEEGCLSFPGLFLKIKRPKEIEIKALDLNGQEIKRKFNGLDARVIQHEIDHLNGILFIDRLSWLEKLKLKKKIAAVV